MKVNNYDCGIYQEGEVYIQTEPRQMEATQGRVYLTTRELHHLLALAEISELSPLQVEVRSPGRLDF